jgi:hypothetical protein
MGRPTTIDGRPAIDMRPQNMTDDLVTVVFGWSPKHGKCYECSLPAAYEMANGYVADEPVWSDEPDPENLRCSVCAAMAAANGERIRWMFADEYPW